jgi:hypothetical protein
VTAVVDRQYGGFPVGSPRLLRGPHALRVPRDLRHHTRIHTPSPLILWDDWPLWLEETGVPLPRSTSWSWTPCRPATSGFWARALQPKGHEEHNNAY